MLDRRVMLVCTYAFPVVVGPVLERKLSQCWMDDRWMFSKARVAFPWHLLGDECVRRRQIRTYLWNDKSLKSGRVRHRVHPS